MSGIPEELPETEDAMEDDLKPRGPAGTVTLGEDLSTHSIDELNARITLCESEISRIRGILAEKERSQSAAERFFRS